MSRCLDRRGFKKSKINPFVADLIRAKQYPNRNGTLMSAPPFYPLADGLVRHVGDPIALAVGNSAAAAIEALEAIAVTWKALPAVVETEKAEKGPSIWSGIPGNLCYNWDTGNAEKVKEALDTAEY